MNIGQSQQTECREHENADAGAKIAAIERYAELKQASAHQPAGGDLAVGLVQSEPALNSTLESKQQCGKENQVRHQS